MPKKPKKVKRKKPSSNPLNNLNLSSYFDTEQEKETKKEDSYKNLQKEYEKILHKGVQGGIKAYRVVFKNHPNLLYIAFVANRGSAKYQASRYFKDTFHPFFTTKEYSKEMLDSHSYRIQEFDQYALEGGLIPIPKLLQVLDITMSCSVCGKDHFNYLDYKEGRCFIIEGEGNLNPFTKGYILCHECYKKYIKK